MKVGGFKPAYQSRWGMHAGLNGGLPARYVERSWKGFPRENMDDLLTLGARLRGVRQISPQSWRRLCVWLSTRMA